MQAHRKILQLNLLAEQHKCNRHTFANTIKIISSSPFSPPKHKDYVLVEKEKKKKKPGTKWPSRQKAPAACDPGPCTDSEVLVCTLLDTVSERLGSSNNYWGCLGCTRGLTQTLVLTFTSHFITGTEALQLPACNTQRPDAMLLVWKGAITWYKCMFVFFWHDASTMHELSVPVCLKSHEASFLISLHRDRAAPADPLNEPLRAQAATSSSVEDMQIC